MKQILKNINKNKISLCLTLLALVSTPCINTYAYLIDTASADSINQKDIEAFYQSGFCPYPVNGVFAADTLMWSQEFNDILNNIANHYNLTHSLSLTVTGENLTREKALGMINETLSFGEPINLTFADRGSVTATLQSAVDNTVFAGILTVDGENKLYPTGDFTKAMAATAIVNLVNYIENNLASIPTGGSSSVDTSKVLRTPIDVNIPFSFNTYSKAYDNGYPMKSYSPCAVKLVAFEEGGWWKVNINGKLEWMYTQDKLVYAHSYQPVYSNLSTLEVREYINPQVFTILEERGDFIKINYGDSDSWISAKNTNHHLNNTTIFNIPENFNINMSPKYDHTSNTINEILYPAQTVELVKIAENGYWYIECSGAEGWYDSRGNYIYIPDGVNLYDKNDIESKVVGTLNRQVLVVEETIDSFTKVPTWLGSKWITL